MSLWKKIEIKNYLGEWNDPWIIHSWDRDYYHWTISIITKYWNYVRTTKNTHKQTVERYNKCLNYDESNK